MLVCAESQEEQQSGHEWKRDLLRFHNVQKLKLEWIMRCRDLYHWIVVRVPAFSQPESRSEYHHNCEIQIFHGITVDRHNQKLATATTTTTTNLVVLTAYSSCAQQFSMSNYL